MCGHVFMQDTECIKCGKTLVEAIGEMPLDDHDAVNERAAIEQELRFGLETILAMMRGGEDAADFDDPEPKSPIVTAINAIHASRKTRPNEWWPK